MTGGQELTIVSTAESAVTDNVRFEVKGSTKLVLDIPDLTITGIVDSVSRYLARHRRYLPVLQSDVDEEGRRRESFLSIGREIQRVAVSSSLYFPKHPEANVFLRSIQDKAFLSMNHVRFFGAKYHATARYPPNRLPKILRVFHDFKGVVAAAWALLSSPSAEFLTWARSR